MIELLKALITNGGIILSIFAKEGYHGTRENWIFAKNKTVE